jgi:hypothetical protein
MRARAETGPQRNKDVVVAVGTQVEVGNSSGAWAALGVMTGQRRVQRGRNSSTFLWQGPRCRSEMLLDIAAGSRGETERVRRGRSKERERRERQSRVKVQRGVCAAGQGQSVAPVLKGQPGTRAAGTWHAFRARERAAAAQGPGLYYSSAWETTKFRRSAATRERVVVLRLWVW